MWGPWATGMAATDPRIAARFTKSGLLLIQPQAGIQLLAMALGCLTQHSTPLAAPLVWARLLAPPAHVPQFLEDFAPSRARPEAAVAGRAPAVVGSVATVATAVARIVEAMLGAVVAHNQVRPSSHKILQGPLRPVCTRNKGKKKKRGDKHGPWPLQGLKRLVCHNRIFHLIIVFS